MTRCDARREPVRKAYDMGRKLQWLDGPVEGGNGITKLSDAGAAAAKWRLVEDFTTRYNSLVEIPGIAICLAERRNMVLRCIQDGFLAHVHKYLGFLITDPVDMLR
jgi:hypothetical protein